MKAICWMEKVAEFPTELRATQGRLAWAIKDRIVESLSSAANETSAAIPSGPASKAGGASDGRDVRRWMADLGVDKASLGMGFLEMVGRSSYPTRKATSDRRRWLRKNTNTLWLGSARNMLRSSRLL